MKPCRCSSAVLAAALALGLAAGALAQGTGYPPGHPTTKGASPISPDAQDANRTYADCVNEKRDEMQRYHRARELRDILDQRDRYAALLAANPQMAKQYPGGIDQVIDEGFKRYREAGGKAATPQAVQPGEPPCVPRVGPPSESRAARALQPPPPALREAERGFESCVAQNRLAQDLWQATERVVVAVDRRDELRKVGERLDWADMTRDNLQRSERELGESWARYRSLGGTARSAEEVKRSEEPCRDARAKLAVALREAYGRDGSTVSQTRSIPVPSGSAPVPAPKATPR